MRKSKIIGRIATAVLVVMTCSFGMNSSIKADETENTGYVPMPWEENVPSYESPNAKIATSIPSSYMNNIDKIEENGIFLLNTTKSKEEVLDLFTSRDKKIIEERKKQQREGFRNANLELECSLGLPLSNAWVASHEALALTSSSRTVPPFKLD